MTDDTYEEVLTDEMRGHLDRGMGYGAAAMMKSVLESSRVEDSFKLDIYKELERAKEGAISGSITERYDDDVSVDEALKRYTLEIGEAFASEWDTHLTGAPETSAEPYDETGTGPEPEPEPEPSGEPTDEPEPYGPDPKPEPEPDDEPDEEPYDTDPDDTPRDGPDDDPDETATPWDDPFDTDPDDDDTGPDGEDTGTDADGYRVAISDIHGFMNQAVGDGASYTGVLDAIGNDAFDQPDETDIGKLIEYSISDSTGGYSPDMLDPESVKGETDPDRTYSFDWVADDDVELYFDGDLIDRGPHSEQAVEMAFELMEDDNAGDNVTWLPGNHDMAFAMPDVWGIGDYAQYEEDGDGNPADERKEELRREFLEKAADGDIPLVAEGFNFLYSHAGVLEDRGPLGGDDLVSEWNDRWQAAADDLLDVYDAFQDGALDRDGWAAEQENIANEYLDVFAVGMRRGGSTMAGGPGWLDYNTLLDAKDDDTPAQIVGHTKGDAMDDGGWNPRQDDQVININTIRDYVEQRIEGYSENPDQKIAVSVEEPDKVYALEWDPEFEEMSYTPFETPETGGPDDGGPDTPDDTDVDTDADPDTDTDTDTDDDDRYTIDASIEAAPAKAPDSGYHNNLLEGTFFNKVADTFGFINDDPIMSSLLGNASGSHDFVNAQNPEQYWLEVSGNEAGAINADDSPYDLEVSLVHFDEYEMASSLSRSTSMVDIDWDSLVSSTRSFGDLHGEDLKRMNSFRGTSARNDGSQYKTPVWLEEIEAENPGAFGALGEWDDMSEYLADGSVGVMTTVKRDGEPVFDKNGRPLEARFDFGSNDYGLIDLGRDTSNLREAANNGTARTLWDGFWGSSGTRAADAAREASPGQRSSHNNWRDFAQDFASDLLGAGIVHQYMERRSRGS